MDGLSPEDCLAALPSLVSFARKHCDDQGEALLSVIEQFCSELDKGTLQCEQTETGHMRYTIVVRVPPLFSLVLSHVRLSAYVISASVGYRSSRV